MKTSSWFGRTLAVVALGAFFTVLGLFVPGAEDLGAVSVSTLARAAGLPVVQSPSL